MRKTSEEFNSNTVIKNVWGLCKEKPAVDELPYWETVNRYPQQVDPCHLLRVINSLCRRLLYNMRNDPVGKSLYYIHQKITEKKYQENYYYILEAKMVLYTKIILSFQTEFVEKEDRREDEKQDCERRACRRLMEKISEAFPRLPV